MTRIYNFSFNPTLVRLRPIRPMTHLLVIFDGFNPTLVRLRLDLHHMSEFFQLLFQSHAGSIEARELWMATLDSMLFQSHAGSIEA